VIENRPGAGGNLAGGVVANARADGHTLLLSQYDSMTIAKAGGAKLGYDPETDLVPVAQVGLSTTLFLVNADSSFKTFSDFVSYAKDHPGKLNFGSNGHGGSYHLGVEQLNSVAGISIAHIPYNGGAPSMVDLIAGRVDAILASTSLGLPHLQSGKVRLLALGSARPSDLYPGIPTIAASGYADYDVSLGLGIFVPKGTPDGLINKLNRDINLALKDESLQKQFAMEGVEPTTRTPAEFKATLRKDIQEKEALMKKLNITLQ